MRCRVTDMKNKEVICRSNGVKLGCVDDVEIDVKTAKLVAIVVYGRLKCFGLLGRTDDMVIHWDSIALIGEDTILVDCQCDNFKKKKKFFGLKMH